MDTGTIFVTVSFIMLANGIVLLALAPDLPRSLQPAARYWQGGTVLGAIGCAVLVLGGGLPRPLMLLLANGCMIFCLTAYYAAVQSFDGRRPRWWQALPAVSVLGVIAWFSMVTESFAVRLVYCAVIWGGLMVATIHSLCRGATAKMPASRRILIGIFAVVLIYHLVRVIIYLRADLDDAFAIESGDHWLNVVSPIFMTLLAIVGTTAFLLMCSDHLRQQLEVAASTDYLTGLVNRRTLALRGATRFEAAQDRGEAFAVAVLDLDNFKSINDTYGHDVGDLVLIDIANCLKLNAGPESVVARAGGEEFTVLLRDRDIASAAAATERLRQAVEQTEFHMGMTTIPVTLSAGVAVYRAGDRKFEDVLRRADQALYRAKAGGRNRVEVARLAAVPA